MKYIQVSGMNIALYITRFCGINAASYASFTKLSNAFSAEYANLVMKYF